MDCDRAFLSLIDNRSQFICAEMTRDQSLGRQNPVQPLLLGTARVPLGWGVCPYTMAVFHGKTNIIPETPYIVANPSYFYIQDFRLVPLFAARPYVTGYPRMVSYIEVPLQSLSGHILGSYCVVDNKPRDFLQPALLQTLREATSAISSYLDMKRAEVNRTRSERMMSSLSQFIASERNISCPERNSIQAGGVPAGPFELDVFRQSSRTNSTASTDEKPELEQPSYLSARGYGPGDLTDDRYQRRGDARLHTSRTPLLGTLSSTPSPTSKPARSDCPTTGSSGNTSRSSTREHPSISQRTLPSLSSQIGSLFARAAKTIGYALAVDGLVFFDAIKTSTSYHRNRSSSLFENDERVNTSAYKASPGAVVLSEYRGNHGDEKHLVCRPSQSTIKQLTTRYPQGHVFVMDEHGVLDYSAHDQANTESRSNDITVADNDEQDVLRCMPKARYAIFLPLWHYQRESCFATCLVWVSDSAKTLDTGDINSLTAFGNSLMIEILRLEASTIARSKSDFISSISHELRSPLHGIVATIELMQENVKDSSLLSMMDMIGLCSSTLLDTFDHLLEYAKINSHPSGVHSDSSTSRPYGASDTKRIAADLGSLLEEVVEVVSLGYSQALQMDFGLKEEQQDARDGQPYQASSKPVLITTYVEGRDWFLPIKIGAWKRILLNIVSNALKYTESGYIDLSLEMSQKSHGRARYICLSVTDTGVGMSSDFLKYHVFTPFMQENNLSPGTGLGLSLVKSIVESLGGNISIKSRQGEGTCVTINIPIDDNSKIPDISGAPNERNVFVTETESWGKSLGLISIASSGKTPSKTVPRILAPPKALQRVVRNICQGSRLDVNVVEFSDEAIPETDIVILDTCALTDDLDWGHLFAGFTTSPSVIVLGTIWNGSAECHSIGNITYLKSPITGKKLRNALLKAHSTKSMSLTSPLVDLPHRAKQASSEHLYSELASDDTSNIRVSRSLESSSAVPLPPKSSHRTMAPKSAPSVAVMSRFKRFLLVDDNPINLKLLVAFITRIDRPYSTANNGAEAVRLYQEAASEEARPFDCIFMDISMPVMDGFQATAAIRQFEQSQSHSTNDDIIGDGSKSALHAYILALTGLGSDDARIAARVSGVNEFLLKPVKFKDIVPLLGPQ